MGKWVGKNYDEDFLTKSKGIFQVELEKLKRDDPDIDLPFEDFVEAFDGNDRFTRRLFHFIIKEAISRHRMRKASAARRDSAQGPVSSHANVVNEEAATTDQNTEARGTHRRLFAERTADRQRRRLEYDTTNGGIRYAYSENNNMPRLSAFLNEISSPQFLALLSNARNNAFNNTSHGSSSNVATENQTRSTTYVAPTSDSGLNNNVFSTVRRPGAVISASIRLTREQPSSSTQATISPTGTNSTRRFPSYNGGATTPSVAVTANGNGVVASTHSASRSNRRSQSSRNFRFRPLLNPTLPSTTTLNNTQLSSNNNTPNVSGVLGANSTRRGSGSSAESESDVEGPAMETDDVFPDPDVVQNRMSGRWRTGRNSRPEL